jgi:hypothetical protein
MSKLEKRLAFKQTDHHKGLLNQLGENNCFLNVTIQALWHLGPFRTHLQQLIAVSGNQKAMGLKKQSISLIEPLVPSSKQLTDYDGDKSMDARNNYLEMSHLEGDEKTTEESRSMSNITGEKIFCRNSEESSDEEDQDSKGATSVSTSSSLLTSLCNLFIQYEFTDQSVLPPNELRESLAKLSSDYELGKIADAVETLDVILQRIHTEFHEVCPSTMKCLAHITFGGMILEQTICHLCGGSSEPTVRNNFLLYFQAAEILHELEAIKPPVKLVSLTSQSQPFLTLSMLKKAAKAGFLGNTVFHHSHFEKIMKKELLKSKQFSAILKRCMMSLGKKSCPSLEEEQRRQKQAEDEQQITETTRSEDIASSRSESASRTTGSYSPNRATEERSQSSPFQRQQQMIKCEGEASVFFFSLDPPLIFTISIGWTDNWESHDNLHKFYSLISSVLSLNDIFSDDINSQNRKLPPQWRNIPGNSSQNPIIIDEKSLFSSSNTGASADLEGPCYIFRGMVCYYGLHYVSIFVDSSMNSNSHVSSTSSSSSHRVGKRENNEEEGIADPNSTADGETYLLFDDSRIRPIGGWKDVVSYCVASCYQPVLLLYELEKHSLKYTTERNGQDLSNLNILGERGVNLRQEDASSSDVKDELKVWRTQEKEEQSLSSSPFVRSNDSGDEEDLGFLVVSRDLDEEQELANRRVPDLLLFDLKENEQIQDVRISTDPFLEMKNVNCRDSSSIGRFWHRVDEAKVESMKDTKQFSSLNEQQQGSFITGLSIFPATFDDTAAQPKNSRNYFPDTNKKPSSFKQDGLINATSTSSSLASYHSCVSSKSISSNNQISSYYNPQQLQQLPQQEHQSPLINVSGSLKREVSSKNNIQSLITSWGRRPYRYRISLPLIRVNLDSERDNDISETRDQRVGRELKAVDTAGQQAINPKVILGIILDLNERNEMLVTDFYRHPFTKEPLAAEMSGKIQFLDQLISVNGQSLSHLAEKEQEMMIENQTAALGSTCKDTNSRDDFVHSPPMSDYNRMLSLSSALASPFSKIPNKLRLIHKLINSLSEPFILLEFQSCSLSVLWYRCPSCSFVNEVLPEKEQQLKKQLKSRLSNGKITSNDNSNNHSIQNYRVFFKCKFCSTRNLCDSYLPDLSSD